MVKPLQVATPAEKDLITDHEQWLAGDSRALAIWQSRINEPGERHESAVAEAVVRWVFSRFFAEVLPGEIHGEGPDLICSTNGTSIAVEVTSLPRGPLNDWYGFDASEYPPTGIGGLKLIYERVGRKVQGKSNKQDQAAKTTAPFLLAVTAQHRTGAQQIAGELTASFLLTGRQSVIMLPSAPGEERSPPTRLASGRSSAFHRQDGSGSEGLLPIRQEISGLLLVGIHTSSVQMTGLLNPWAARPIDSIGLEGLPTDFVQGTDPNQFTLCWKS